VTNDGEFKAKLISLALDQELIVRVTSNFIHFDQRSRYYGLPVIIYHYGR